MEFTKKLICLSVLIVTGTANGDGVKPMQLQAAVTRDGVCDQMMTDLTNYGVSIGLPKSTSRVYAGESIKQVIANLRRGERTEFLDMRQLPFHKEVAPRPENSYLNLAAVLGNSLGVQGNLVIGFDINELRFLPQVQVGSNVIMVLRSAEGLTPDRAKAVVAVAQKQQIHISIVWAGDEIKSSPSDPNDNGLAFLASVTGGRFADIGGHRELCAQIL